ncbi:hypothetical protein [Salipaludibacillus aurantiacus]|uniref:Serine/threonine protein kinase n=1 Tax=Salipaludibacillus aurantiacus TaxID=1601833 RepID=A0A1H9X6Y3_9BACI|nr:hypothetical protein [Salipaludibacillus aurantiacus]SES41839.1 hypothetical protein SAMN05518684_12723 [Salipaludibacillus aurantiacus]
MDDFKSISVRKGEKDLEIDNPTSYPLAGKGSQGAVFKLSEKKCVKLFIDPVQAKMEQEAIEAGRQLSFMPEVYETGANYIVMEYFDGPDLKAYLKNGMFMPESTAKKLLTILKQMKETGFTMIDAPLRHIFVMENEEFKVIDHVNAFKRDHPVPLKLLRDLNLILLKESFLMHVEKLEPQMFREWESYYDRNKIDFRNIPIESGGSGQGVKFDSSISLPFVGKGHQGAVFRIEEDKCVKIYGKTNHAEQEQKVLLSSQNLSFIPKVYETDSNYTVMEYLLGPDLNSYLKKQRLLSKEVAEGLLNILTTMKKAGFKQIDAPLRHTIMTANGFKVIDHVYSFARDQKIPVELFENLAERHFLLSFIEQVKVIAPETYKEWDTPELDFWLEQEKLQMSAKKKSEGTNRCTIPGSQTSSDIKNNTFQNPISPNEMNSFQKSGKDPNQEVTKSQTTSEAPDKAKKRPGKRKAQNVNRGNNKGKLTKRRLNRAGRRKRGNRGKYRTVKKGTEEWPLNYIIKV